jgi:class 3 adenylate cyclase/predicted ATPase
VQCQSCGKANREGVKFCSSCGTPLHRACPVCGTPAEPADRFCGECGSPVSDAARPAAAEERRLVSVLFADLVGFTTLSEHRDPEEVRELLERYFDRCRSLIERYGGTVEKFIGDAVMAVWGTPVAREDDAERAVRAALMLTSAVSALGQEAGLPGLHVRAGVLTGEAAVRLRGTDSMVLGDTVNTASRLQTIAPPDGVLVDDVTRRATEAAIVYEDAGVHELKGREAPVHAWRALRVVALVGGARRGTGLEPPFVGRERELEAVIARLEATLTARRAELAAVVGVAGAGKSRLAWEFWKHVDGIKDVVWWHAGRCLSYGEGVAYWALAEMVRGRARIAEDEDPASAREKLAAVVAEHVPDERERRLVEPRLAHLLGFERRVAPDRADLFSGWRLFFERLTATGPVIMVFEDLQWADSGLLDFIDYLLEWSAEFPLFILAFGRPELLERRPAWAERAIELAPLGDEAIDELVTGLVPGLPDDLRARIRARSEGLPLYAVETVRMLLDRGVLAQDGAQYVVTGDVEDLEVPETLQALVAARLDNLSPDERGVLQDAAVFGQTFTAAAVAAVGDRTEGETVRLLRALIAKQVLRYEDDPRSAERGQFAFLQALIRTVAYGTLARRDRKARHLAAARFLRDSGSELADLAEVLAAHELEAMRAEPDAADAAELRASAAATLADAGRRAVSLALGAEAQRYFEQAAELTEAPAERAALLEQAGRAAWSVADAAGALAQLERAIELHVAHGEAGAAARLQAAVGDILWQSGRLEEAGTLLDQVLADLRDAEPDPALAEALARGAQIAFLRNDPERAFELAERALDLAESLRVPGPLADAMTTKAITYHAFRGRHEEAAALMAHARDFALAQGLVSQALRASFNLAEMNAYYGRLSESVAQLDEALVLARERGDRPWEAHLLVQQLMPMRWLGQWDETLERVKLVSVVRVNNIYAAAAIVSIATERGDRLAIEQVLGALPSDELILDEALLRDCVVACGARGLGRPQEAVPVVLGSLRKGVDLLGTSALELYLEAGGSALAAGDPAALREAVELVEALPLGAASPLMPALTARFRAHLAPDPASAAELFRRSAGLHREFELPFGLAQVLVEHAELLERGSNPGEAEPLRREAAEIFARLRAEPWLRRATGSRREPSPAALSLNVD